MKKSIYSIVGFVIIQIILLLVIAILCSIFIQNELISVGARYIILVALAFILNKHWLKQKISLFTGKIEIKNIMLPYICELVLIFFILYGFKYDYTKSELINAICFSIGPGIYEEYVFRGVVLSALIDRFKHSHYWGIIKAVILSSILFGSMHLVNLIGQPSTETILQSITAMIMGLFLAAICIRTKSILPGMILHALSNFVQNSLINSNNLFALIYYIIVIVLTIILLIPRKSNKYQKIQ
ncbi:CPBP family intramembrane glutamic endopeptidase [Lactobacillus sp. Sy-1]|uniref:CPBP family intramembrane glutamic endopeptidase n=1 Tax=Lactobacillus sp. Sy-1 TaxID=2109645 RepID=UPI001C5A79E2|nr:CPBP family intramembrane glutamic endopeptidase [Lactobacillus sp. Sy-1]MBW1606452.1 CPBP family intramembrane metalloprotease [Lactobacillus sp. Sy-1]